MPVMDLRYECRLPLFSFNALSFAHEMQSCFSLGPIHSLIADLNGIRHDGNKIIYKSRVHAPRAHTHISLSSIRFCIFYWIILLQFWSNEEVFSLSLVSLSLSRLTFFVRSFAPSFVRHQRIKLCTFWIYTRFVVVVVVCFPFSSRRTADERASVRLRFVNIWMMSFCGVCWCLDHPSNKISFRRESF